MVDPGLVGELGALAAVAERMQIGGAAGDLGLTPRAVSARLTALERRTGLCLVDRSHRCRIALSPAGQGLAGVARRLVEAVRRAEEELDAVAAGRLGVVRVAVTSDIDPVIGGLLQSLRDVEPGWRIDVGRMRHSTARAALVVGAAECVIGARSYPISSTSFLDPRPNGFESLAAVSFGRGTPPRYAITWRTSWRGPHAAQLVAGAMALAEEDRRAQREAARAGRSPTVFRWPLPDPPDGWY